MNAAGFISFALYGKQPLKNEEQSAAIPSDFSSVIFSVVTFYSLLEEQRTTVSIGHFCWKLYSRLLRSKRQFFEFFSDSSLEMNL